MPNFISTSTLLRQKYSARKDVKVRVSPVPASDMCEHCWYQSLCIFRTMTRQAPQGCCVYEYFVTRGNNESSLEDVVAFTCDIRCRDRQTWVGDPCPHDSSYCTSHCPVSRFITEEPASCADDVPYDDYG